VTLILIWEGLAKLYDILEGEEEDVVEPQNGFPGGLDDGQRHKVDESYDSSVVEVLYSGSSLPSKQNSTPRTKISSVIDLV
jgi:hypothetical protein